jgi:lysophospholipase L1-like esterase
MHRIVAGGVAMLAGVAVAVFVLLGAAHRRADALPVFHSPAPAALVAFGHSFVAGGSPVPVRPTWPVRAARMLHLAPDDRGVDGAMSAEIARIVGAYRVRASDEVVIEPEINDVFMGVGPGHFADNLNRMLAHLEDGPVRPRRVLVLFDPLPLQWRPSFAGVRDGQGGSAPLLARYTAAGQRVVARYPGVMARDLSRGWDPARLENHVDGLHPDAAGVRRIARVVAAALA